MRGLGAFLLGMVVVLLGGDVVVLLVVVGRAVVVVVVVGWAVVVVVLAGTVVVVVGVVVVVAGVTVVMGASATRPTTTERVTRWAAVLEARHTSRSRTGTIVCARTRRAAVDGRARTDAFPLASVVTSVVCRPAPGPSSTIRTPGTAWPASSRTVSRTTVSPWASRGASWSVRYSDPRSPRCAIPSAFMRRARASTSASRPSNPASSAGVRWSTSRRPLG